MKTTRQALLGRWVAVLLLFGLASGCVAPQAQLTRNQTGFTTVDSTIPPDPEMAELVRGYQEQLGAQMNEVIGKAAKDLGNGSGTVESALGNFVADLMRERSMKKFGNPIDLALINARGGLRVPLSQGDITVGNVFELMPFDNDVWILELTGEETRKLFDHCARTRRMAVAGARYEIQGEKAANLQIGGAPFDAGRTYLVALPDFLATGGDRFDFLPQARVAAKLNYLVRDMILDHVRSLNLASTLVEARLDGRVREQP